MAVDGDVVLAPDSSGKAVDNSVITRADATTHYRQRINWSDPSDPNAHASVVNSPPPPGYYGGVIYVAANQLPLPTQDAIWDLMTTVQDDGTRVLNDNIASVGGFPINIGPSVGANCLPVVIASDQTVAMNWAQMNGLEVDAGLGASSPGTQRVAVSADSSITANAGAGLNTSALALEQGGNLAALLLLNQNSIVELLKAILAELIVHTTYLQRGLNVPDEADAIRNDPYTIPVLPN